MLLDIRGEGMRMGGPAAPRGEVIGVPMGDPNEGDESPRGMRDNEAKGEGCDSH